jgi:hypothetical protein
MNDRVALRQRYMIGKRFDYRLNSRTTVTTWARFNALVWRGPRASRCVSE